ncbi:hypothetical protein BDV38DRAFT_239687 [Aspergillus pseudotamarii]|uniref:Uncharacterized protein n=1 Tax=Aspergillus pseudotamarii TaxID=132259 RepID=A0A5N6T2A4_ASPPS|nr:uncharacterized protein BDV38DRAFT_239687 [Aspergillus pseudotamarii]KAE8140425.1 hypothetical protein BDV38DRAFT_239687 [Aspergillus pseudotamarii]
MEGPRGKKYAVLILSDNRIALITMFLIFPIYTSFLSRISHGQPLSVQHLESDNAQAGLNNGYQKAQVGFCTLSLISGAR